MTPTARPVSTSDPTVALVTFLVAGHRLAVEAACVREVLASAGQAPVPLAPASVAGLMNLRGEVITVIDVRRRFGFAARPADSAAVNVIINTSGGTSSLLVDEVGDLVDVPAALIRPPPDTFRGPGRDLVRGICQLDGPLLLCLDVAATLDLRSEPAR